MKKMNKVMIAMMMMALTAAMPAAARNNKHYNNNKATVVVVDKNNPHFRSAKMVSRPVVKTCTFRVDRHANRRHVIARAERINGVMNTYWNPRTREVTVTYDARITSARHIMHRVA